MHVTQGLVLLSASLAAASPITGFLNRAAATAADAALSERDNGRDRFDTVGPYANSNAAPGAGPYTHYRRDATPAGAKTPPLPADAVDVGISFDSEYPAPRSADASHKREAAPQDDYGNDSGQNGGFSFHGGIPRSVVAPEGAKKRANNLEDFFPGMSGGSGYPGEPPPSYSQSQGQHRKREAAVEERTPKAAKPSDAPVTPYQGFQSYDNLIG